MLLRDKFSQNFPENVKTAGFFLELQANRLWGGPAEISCEFTQDQGEICSWKIEGKSLIPKCQCDTFLAGKPCKHLWAALLKADRFEDLAMALKRNISREISFASHTSQQTYDYEPQIRRTPTKASQPEHNEEPVIVPLVTQQKKPRTAFTPTIDSSLNQEILYVLRTDEMPPYSDKLLIETWWRPQTSANQKPAQPKQLFIDENTTVKTLKDTIALYMLTLWGEPSSPPNRFLFPASQIHLLEQLSESNSLYSVYNSAGTLKMTKLSFASIAHKGEIRFSFQQLPDARYLVSFIISDFSFIFKQEDVAIIIQPPTSPESPNPTGYILANSQLYPVNFRHSALLASTLAGHPPIEMSYMKAVNFAKRLAMESDIPTESFPKALGITTTRPIPTGELYVRTAKFLYQGKEQLHAELSFNYDGVSCPDESKDKRFASARSIIIRDPIEENLLRTKLLQLGFRYNTKASLEEPGWKLQPSQLHDAVMALTADGWYVKAEGKTYRRPTVKQTYVSSGLDWFDIKAGISFDGMEPSLPELLKAIRNGSNTVRLDDGTYGLLPNEWLAQFTMLTEIGEVMDDKLRFKIEQAALISAILGDRLSEAGEQFAQQLKTFENLAAPQPASPPAGFKATLRDYQALGLGWLKNMQKAALGACLADDMGLGKTIQVLAVLAERARIPGHLPSLIVMPRSLIFNWQAEAQKFAPWLRILLHVGSSRSCSKFPFAACDIALTTYGTLRNDATKLAKIDFDYCVLDESQAIKNHESVTAKAARCIKAKYRIAMTGTPIENHLGELFSQLDFLNPGLFPKSCWATAPSPDNTSENSVISRIRKAVRPFILRRTKQEVATDLPPKTEQILWCEMPEKDRAEYNELLLYYQKEIFGNRAPEAMGIQAIADQTRLHQEECHSDLLDDSPAKDASPNKMQLIAALTRLRQAACHPGLLKDSRAKDTSAKLEILVANLENICEAGHKALVFSQFTTFLKIIRTRLEDCGYGISYLDGETKDRAAEVETFQNDPRKQVFLISLNAGGVGINLTAAEYVFLMDPWWNPATESQAIDRIYRIGQKHPVMAYRIVTKDTIEEKVLQLQNAKRKLAAAVIDEDAGIPVKFSIKDYEQLLK